MARKNSLPVVLVVFLLVMSLGEAFALFLEYQNNTYLQRYVAENGSQVIVGIVSLLLLSGGASYLAYLALRAPASSRARGFFRRLSSLSPFLVGVVALIVWFALLSRVVGGSLVNFEIYIVAVLLAVSAWLMAGDRITVRMAVRNFTRRKTSMALVIMGLMIGTAMISGSLVTGDTLTELFTRGAYFGYGYADEVVYARNPLTLGYQYFSLNTSRDLALKLLADPTAGSYVLGVTPEIIDTVSVNNTGKGLIQAGALLIGTFPNASRTLGDFHSADKSVIASSFADTEAILNDRAARDLNATVGDTLLVYSANTLFFKVVGVAVSDARAYFFQGDNVFVTMSAAQKLTGRAGQTNYAAITNIGGVRGSIQYSQTVGLAANRTLNAILGPQPGLGCKADPSARSGSTTIQCAYSEKKTAVDNAVDSAKSLSNFFVVLSTFAIIAGVVLIVNIFVMLAEERKSEMGMARAVGMKRSQLTKLFLFEGSLYAAGSAFVGVFVGIGIAYAILYTFGTIITSFFPVNLAQVLNSFTYTPASLFTGFTEGLLITYFTILLTSWRVSKLNIIRAIRNVPEPPRGIRTYTLLLLVGVASIVVGILLFRQSFTSKSAVEALVGPSLVIFGGGLVLARFLRNRYAFTMTGAAFLVQWGVPSFSWNNPLIKNYDFGPELFFAGGILMVVGAILVVMYNTDIAVKFLRLIYRGRKTLTPIFKTALSYPENKRFRTAATVAMFALVIFTVSAIASIAAEQNAALDKLVREQSGGYDIISQIATPVSNMSARVLADPNLRNKVASVIPFNTTVLSEARDLTSGRGFSFPILVGADPDTPTGGNFFLTNTFRMLNQVDSYKTTGDVWNAVRANSSLVVWSVGFIQNRGPPRPLENPNPGDILTLVGFAGRIPVAKNVTVVGVLNGVFFNGIVARSQLLSDVFGVGAGTLSFMKVTTGVDPTSVSNILRRDFAGLRMQTLVIPVLVGDFVQIGQSFLALFEGFLALGLVVGIAGLGIISIRSVVERRQEIGILRALGFRKRMVVAAFLLENSYIALLGILIGVSLGVNLGYGIAVSPNSSLTFVLPWQGILEIVAFAYGLALLTTFSSARRAGRIPPAEALRYFE